VNEKKNKKSESCHETPQVKGKKKRKKKSQVTRKKEKMKENHTALVSESRLCISQSSSI